MRSLFRPVVLLLAVAAAACVTAPGEDDEGASSDLSQGSGSPRIENSPFLWADDAYTNFRAMREEIGAPLEPVLSDEDMLARRAQTWIDRIDAIVRADVERDSGRPLAAPKPIAKIVHSNVTFNAWVSLTFACLGPQTFGPAPATALLTSNQTAAWWLPTCARPGWDRADFASFWNESRFACRLSTTGDGFGISGAGCTAPPDASRVSDVIVYSTSPYVHFSTDYLAAISETSLALTTAHELGHYYLAHTTDLGLSKASYWFQRSPGEAGTRRAPNQEALAAAYAEVAQKDPTVGPRLGSFYSPRMHDLLVRVVWPLLAERQEPDFVCKKANDALAPVVGELQASSGPYTEAARDGFAKFERELRACAPRLGLRDASPQSISAGTLLFQSKVHRPGPKVKLTLSLGDRLGDYLDRLDVQAKELDTKAARLVERARTNHIGLYTIEQQADDFSFFVGRRLGFTAEEIIAEQLDTMRIVEALIERSLPSDQVDAHLASRGEMRADACQALLDAGFTRNEGGRRVPVTVDLGQLDEPHHASCYRVFNLYQLSKTARPRVGPKQAPLDPPWDVLKAHAAELVQSAPPPPAPATPADGAASGT